jgi:thiol-disulfide isomerase/thioredoxin
MERANERWELIEKSKGLYVSKYLNTQLPMFMRVPAENPNHWQEALPENAVTWTRDTLNRYMQQWYRSNFFTDLNIFDPDMLRTPRYEEKLMEYFQPNQVFIFHPDTVNAEIDKILTKAKANDDVFSRVLVTLFNHYGKFNYIVDENIWVHIAEKWYIPFATWSSDEDKEKWKKEVADRKPNLIGKTAPPIEPLLILPPEHFKAAALDTAIKFDIYAGKVIADFRKELKSKYTILYFWDYNCGHCKKGIQELWSLWEEMKDKDLQIITVQVVESKEAKGKWIDFVNEHNMFGWINAWSPYVYEGYKVENHYKTTYKLSSTPQLYLLDEDKTIILKGSVSLEQVKDFIR